MLLDASYAIWGGAFAALFSLLLGIFVVRSINHVKHVFQVRPEYGPDATNPADMMQDTQHRVLMFLMNQKTDSILAALAKTIEQERQKLGVIVRNPSMTEGIDDSDPLTPEISDRPQTAYQNILPLAQNETPVEEIARQLELSEAEVSLVMRIDAA